MKRLHQLLLASVRLFFGKDVLNLLQGSGRIHDLKSICATHLADFSGFAEQRRDLLHDFICDQPLQIE